MEYTGNMDICGIYSRNNRIGADGNKKGGKKHKNTVYTVYPGRLCHTGRRRGIEHVCTLSCKASYTVEAAVVVPLICLIICAMSVFAIELYEKVYDYAKISAERLESNDRLQESTIRMEEIEFTLLDGMYEEEE